jgi:hypothetical protein
MSANLVKAWQRTESIEKALVKFTRAFSLNFLASDYQVMIDAKATEMHATPATTNRRTAFSLFLQW